MASITRTKDMLHDQLGGDWHTRHSNIRYERTPDPETGDLSIPSPWEGLEYFYARFDTDYALRLSEKLAEIGVNVEGLAGSPHNIPAGKMEIRITRDAIETLSGKAVHDNGKYHPIRWHIEKEMGLPHGDRGVA